MVAAGHHRRPHGRAWRHFVERLRRLPSSRVAPARSTRVALDATASRQATWDLADPCAGEMSSRPPRRRARRAARVLHGFGGSSPSAWVRDAAEFVRLMRTVAASPARPRSRACCCHAAQEARRSRCRLWCSSATASRRIVDGSGRLAGNSESFGLRAFMFHEGRDCGRGAGLPAGRPPSPAAHAFFLQRLRCRSEGAAGRRSPRGPPAASAALGVRRPAPAGWWKIASTSATLSR